MFPVFFDTCVLLKPYLCDTILTVAESRIYRPLWSADVLAELDRNLRKRGASDAQISHRLEQMTRHFPDADVKDYEQLLHPDEFLQDQLDLAPEVVHDAIRRQVSRYRRAPRSVDDLLDILGNEGHGCLGFADACRGDRRFDSWRS